MTNCVAGTYVSTPGSAQNDRACTNCPSGTFSVPNLNANPPQTAATLNAPQCTAFTTCAPGTYVNNPGSATADRTCTACEKTGYYSATPNSANCLAWTVCQPGTFISTLGSVSVNQVCTACAAGSYNDVPDQKSCKLQKVCLPGTKISSPGSATTDKSCVACDDGFFSAGNDATTCTAYTKCSSGKILTDGKPNADTVCAQCPSGTKSTNPISHDCVAITP